MRGFIAVHGCWIIHKGSIAARDQAEELIATSRADLGRRQLPSMGCKNAAEHMQQDLMHACCSVWQKQACAASACGTLPLFPGSRTTRTVSKPCLFVTSNAFLHQQTIHIPQCPKGHRTHMIACCAKAPDSLPRFQANLIS